MKMVSNGCDEICRLIELAEKTVGLLPTPSSQRTSAGETKMVFAPNFRLVAVACAALFCGFGSVSAGDHFTVRLKRPGSYSTSTVRSMRFSPDGSQIAVAHDGKTSLVRTVDGELLQTITFSTDSLDFSRDSSQLLLIGSSGRRLLDLNFGNEHQIKYQPPAGYIGVTLERRNGKLLFSRIETGGPVDLAGQIKVGDELTAVGTTRFRRLTSVTGEMPRFATSLIGGSAGTQLRLAVIPKGKLEPETHVLTRHERRTSGSQVIYAPTRHSVDDSNLIFRPMGDHLQVTSVSTGKVVSRLPLQAPASKVMGISQNSRYVALIRELDEPHRFRKSVRNPEAKKASHTSATSGILQAVADDLYFEEEETYYAVDVYDVTSRRVVGTVPFETEDVDTLVAVPVCYGLHVSKDGSSLSVGTWSRLTNYDVVSGQQNWIIQPALKRNGVRPVNCFALSDRLVVFGSCDGKLRICERQTGEQLRTITIPGDETVDKLIVSPDGHRLSCYVDGVLHIVHISDLLPPSVAD